MRPKEITQIIDKEIDGDWSITNHHDCDLKTCLIRPKKRQIRFGKEIKEVWIVLEEKPLTLDGTQVFYYEERKQFGLALPSKTISYACNFHHTFLAAFKSM